MATQTDQRAQDLFSRTYCGSHHSFEVRSDRRDILDMVGESLWPWFESGDRTGSPLLLKAEVFIDSSTTPRVEDSSYGELCLVHPNERIEYQIACYPAKPEQGRRSLWNETHACNSCFYENENRLVVSGTDPRRVARWTGWLLLERASIELELAGGIFMHSGAVVSPAGAVLLLGSRYAGKTTVGLEMIFGHSWEFLANDISYVLPVGDSLHVGGWPYEINLRLGTLSQFPELRPESAAVPRADQSREQLWFCEEKVTLSPRQFIQRIDSRYRIDAPLIAVVLPHGGPAFEERLTLIERERAREVSPEYIEIGHDPEHPDILGWLPVPGRIEKRQQETLEQLHRLPWFDLDWGRDRAVAGVLLQECVARLTG